MTRLGAAFDGLMSFRLQQAVHIAMVNVEIKDNVARAQEMFESIILDSS